ncbi:PucR family transcriptional regulator [Streptomyces sp. NPDC056105]|uniref:PucR family transcriptional regulator n=1 Tax=Streptomyces sp. NPDC056105 TaxID=3345714 RepID=UPI0035DDDEDC
MWFPELSRSRLRTIVGDEAARGFAIERLAPLRRLTADSGDIPLSTLAAWLGCHGVVDRAAVRLGVHRHTVTARLTRIRSILEVDLDDPDTRTELWLALKWQGQGLASSD